METLYTILCVTSPYALLYVCYMLLINFIHSQSKPQPLYRFLISIQHRVQYFIDMHHVIVYVSGLPVLLLTCMGKNQ